MAPDTEIRLQLPGLLGAEFEKFLNAVGDPKGPPLAEFRPSPKPVGGPSLVHPGIVTVLTSGLLTGVVGGIGKGIGTFLWQKLLEFLKQHNLPRQDRPLTITVNGGDVEVTAGHIVSGSPPPQAFTQLDEIS